MVIKHSQHEEGNPTSVKFLFELINLSFSDFFHVVFPLLILFPLSDLEWFHLIPSTVFIYFSMGFICFFFKDLYHIHEGYFKVFFLSFSCIAVLRTCCGRVPGLWRRHNCPGYYCIFILVSRHLGLRHL